jgi:HK97 family phage major capsid protein
MALIERTDAAALIPEDAANEIIKQMPQASAALQLFRRVPMSRKQKRVPVMSALPTAYWVSPSDTGRKQTTTAEWDNVYLEAEELAVIVPIPEAVLDDSDYDIWSELQPNIVEAFGSKLDAAVLFGTDRPLTWPSAIVDLAVAAGNVLERGSVTNQRLWQDILGEGGVFNLVEEDGFDVDFATARVGFKAALRGEADGEGRPIWTQMPGDSPDQLGGAELFFSKNGSWDDDEADLIVGDRSKALIGVRQDMTYKVLTEAVIQDSNGDIIYNLAQQDMVALRCVMRVGYAVANPANRQNETEGTRCPFAVLAPEDAS